jgi:hypothetical protein
MVTLQLTIREAVILAGMVTGDLLDKVIQGIERCANVGKRVVITDLGAGYKIHSIKCVRQTTGMGLREAKEWVEEICGRVNYDAYDSTTGDYKRIAGKGSNHLDFANAELAQKFLSEMIAVGCKGEIVPLP